MTSQLERELRRRAELNRRLGERSFLSRKISIPETERGCELLMGALKRSNDSIEKALNSMDLADYEFHNAAATWLPKTGSLVRSNPPTAPGPTPRTDP